MAIPFLQFSSKKQASDWCHGGVVIVYVYLLWGQPARGLRFWGILGYNGIASTLNLPSHQNFSVWSSLVKPLRVHATNDNRHPTLLLYGAFHFKMAADAESDLNLQLNDYADDAASMRAPSTV